MRNHQASQAAREEGDCMTERSDHMIETLANNGILLQNAVNMYAKQAQEAIECMKAISLALSKIQNHNAAIEDAINRLHRDSAKETTKLTAALHRMADRIKATKPSRKAK